MSDDAIASPAFVILPLVQPDSDDSIDFSRIRDLTSNGLDYAQAEDRCLAWLVLLGLYPPNAKDWPRELSELVSLYSAYVDECRLVGWEQKKFDAHISDISVFDVDDQLMMFQIHGDIVRTGRHIYLLPCTDDDGASQGNINFYAVHLRRLERILYVMGTANKTISYMQGFNEIIIPFYYTIYLARSLFNNDDFVVEALAFHCLHQVVFSTEIRDLFTTDDRSSILLAKLNEFDKVLQSHVPKVYQVVTKYEIPAVCYCYRWFSLMFSQEYSLPELQQIWDALFTHIDNMVDFEFYVGAAQIEMCSGGIENMDYQESLETLQNISVRNIYQLLSLANEWWRKDHNPTLIESVTSHVSGAAKGIISKLNRFRRK